jgi:hypothetical protein
MSTRDDVLQQALALPPIRRSLRICSNGRLPRHNRFHQNSVSRGRWKLIVASRRMVGVNWPV